MAVHHSVRLYCQTGDGSALELGVAEGADRVRARIIDLIDGTDRGVYVDADATELLRAVAVLEATRNHQEDPAP